MFRFLAIVLLILVSASLRLAELGWNFAPIGALALFAGAYFKQRWLAISIPVLAMVCSDIALGLVNQNMGDYFLSARQPFIYLCFALYAFLGMGLRGYWQRTEAAETEPARTMITRTTSVAGGAFVGSILFFLLSNFGSFLTMYPHTWEGLAECYRLAKDFYRQTLQSDLLFSAILFGGYALITQAVPELEESPLVYTD